MFLYLAGHGIYRGLNLSASNQSKKDDQENLHDN